MIPFNHAFPRGSFVVQLKGRRNAAQRHYPGVVQLKCPRCGQNIIMLRRQKADPKVFVCFNRACAWWGNA